ncbi:hypothetical protein C0J52_18237 [Blattella germanica]|nr:hypothetical protein C0J52_18237 [Blattella germanica]
MPTMANHHRPIGSQHAIFMPPMTSPNSSNADHNHSGARLPTDELLEARAHKVHDNCKHHESAKHLGTSLPPTNQETKSEICETDALFH